MAYSKVFKFWPLTLLALLGIIAVACGGAAEPTQAPQAQPTTALLQPTATPPPDSTPTPAPTATAVPEDIVSTKDDIVLVAPEEPVALGAFYNIGAALNASITRSNLQDPLTWQSGDNLRIVPTSATTGWEQRDDSTWRFQLREGVKFHNGEAWNADAALYSFASEGSPASEGGSINYTGSYTAAKVDDFTVDITCDNPCPIFPNTSFFLNFEAPELHASASEEERVRRSVGFGPYKHVDWQAGIKITQEAYEDYVPVGDHFEFQKPRIKNVEWVWRAEPTVIAAMIQSGEADLGWDLGVDSVGALPAENLRFGSSAEMYSFTTNIVWHPELAKKKVRQAMVHAIDCQELVDNLYAGYTTCRGNIIWPGIIGATEANTAPYEYNPELSRQLLEEAGYNPENKITISTRGARVAKQIEVSEALVGYWTDVGMNVDLQIVESATRSAMTRCGVGKATLEVVEASGRDPATTIATLEDFQAAVDKGGADCPTGHLIGNQPSNETLDFGRQVRYYLSCDGVRALFCDPSPGGLQEQIPAALAASGAERQELLSQIADRFHEDVLFIPLFDLPVIYGVNENLNWKPRLDPAIRVSAMWFSE